MRSSLLTVVNPFNQQTVCELPYEKEADIDAKLNAAQQALTHWRQLSLDERSERVRQGLACFRDEAEQTVRNVSLQMGKPITQARGEVNTLLDRAEQSLADAPGGAGGGCVAREGGVRATNRA